MSAETGRKLLQRVFPSSRSEFVEQAKKNAKKTAGSLQTPYGERGVFATEKERVTALADAYELRDKLEKNPDYFQQIPFENYIDANEAIGEMFASLADYSSLSPEMAEKIKKLDSSPDKNNLFKKFFKGRGINVYYTGAPIPENTSGESKRILSFSAHPDDTEIELATRAMHETMRGNIWMEFNLTSGAAGGLDRGMLTQEEISVLRWKEMMRSARILGIPYVIVPYNENHPDVDGRPALGMREYLQDPEITAMFYAHLLNRIIPADVIITHGNLSEDAHPDHQLAYQIGTHMAHEGNWTHYNSNVVPDMRKNPPKQIALERVVMWDGEKAFKPNKFTKYDRYSPAADLALTALMEHPTQNAGFGYYEAKVAKDTISGVLYHDSVNRFQNIDRAIKYGYDEKFLDKTKPMVHPLYESYFAEAGAEILTFTPEEEAILAARNAYYEKPEVQQKSSYDFITSEEPVFA